MTLRILALLAALTLAGPASAHAMKVFAHVVGDEVSGYGFFVGGGRPQGVDWSAEMAGAPLANGKTDAEGGFAFAVPAPVTGVVRVTINTGDGHIAHADLPPGRFGAAPGPVAPIIVAPSAQVGAEVGAAAPAPDALSPLLEAAVERAVAPLEERIEQMDDRMRLTDVMSGIFLIIGLAGIGLWARGRRR